MTDLSAVKAEIQRQRALCNGQRQWTTPPEAVSTMRTLLAIAEAAAELLEDCRTDGLAGGSIDALASQLSRLTEGR